MSQIRITPEEMRNAAKNYRTEAEEVNGIIKKMDNYLATLMQEFVGETSKSFDQRYNELKPGFVKTQELIEEIATALETTAKVFEETDGKIAGLMGGK
mgnify:CR=1 FL=1